MPVFTKPQIKDYPLTCLILYQAWTYMEIQRMTYIRECLEGMAEVLIVTHKKPDGDAIGCAIAWYHRLKREMEGMRVSLYMNDAEIPNEYRFLLDGIDLKTQDYAPLDPLCLLSLDTSSFDRLRLPINLPKDLKVINIDHHISNEIFGDWNIVLDSSSVCEISAEIFKSSLDITQTEAECLYLGILTDSGQFAYPLTTARTLEIAGMLIRCGANPNKIAQNAFFNRPFRYFQLLARAIERVVRIGYFTIFIIRAEDMRELSLNLPDLEQFSSFTVRNKETEVGILLIELEDCLTKCSFRSKGGVDVNTFAKIWGGGGHKTASGAYINKGIDRVLDEIVEEIGKGNA